MAIDSWHRGKPRRLLITTPKTFLLLILSLKFNYIVGFRSVVSKCESLAIHRSTLIFRSSNANDNSELSSGPSLVPFLDLCARNGLQSATLVVSHQGNPLSKPEGAVHIKSVIFQARGTPFVAVMPDDLVADCARIARYLGLPKRQVTLAGARFVEELTGYQVGTVPPFGHRISLRTLVDTELLNYDTIIGGCGSSDYHLSISLDELLRTSRAELLDLARPKINSVGDGNVRMAPPSDNQVSQGAVLVHSSEVGGGGISYSKSPDFEMQQGEAKVGESGMDRVDMEGLTESSASVKVAESVANGRLTTGDVTALASAMHAATTALLSLMGPAKKDTGVVSGDIKGVNVNGVSNASSSLASRSLAQQRGQEEEQLQGLGHTFLDPTTPSTEGEFGDALVQAAGTPTVDAIGGDVHLVAVVAGKRTLTRQLHFVDLVPPEEPLPMPGQACRVRKSWVMPGGGDGSQRVVQVQLIMGKTLVDRLGMERAVAVMQGVKRGQLIYITGRPSPSVKTPSSSPSLDSMRDPHQSFSYDLVCRSVRVLEEPPEEMPELVGQGDEWDEPQEGEENGVGSNGLSYLEMDLPKEAVLYVDSEQGLRDMHRYFQENLKEGLPPSSSGTKGPSPVSPVVSFDCEWQPGRDIGQKHPVSLLQIAIRERTYVVDMLHVCGSPWDAPSPLPRPHPMRLPTPLTPWSNEHGGKAKDYRRGGELGEGGLGLGQGASRSTSTLRELRPSEKLLQEALGAVLRDAEVVKVGFVPQSDLVKLMRSYPHIPCFAEVTSVINLSGLARNAESLRGVPAEEKGSLSRLSNLVLGKPLNKGEQCANWGMRPLSNRQKRYAALDARATLLIYRKLAPEVSCSRFQSMLKTYTYDPKAFRFSGMPTLPCGRKPSGTHSLERGRRGEESGGARVSIDVSKAVADFNGLKKRWLGRALPGLRKEVVVSECLRGQPGREGGHTSSSGSVQPFLHFDRHQAFVEFQNGFALFMNCGGKGKQVEHTSGFLHGGAEAIWYLRGSVTVSPGRNGDPDAVVRLLQSFLSSGSASPSLLGEIPADRNGRGGDMGSGDWAEVVGAADVVGKRGEEWPNKESTVDASLLGEALQEDYLDLREELNSNVMVESSSQLLGGGNSGGEKESMPGVVPRGQNGNEVLVSPPQLALFARAKGKPYVYCGLVECLEHEYVWSRESIRLGMVRLRLGLQDWGEAFEVEGRGGGGDVPEVFVEGALKLDQEKEGGVTRLEV